MWYGTGFFGGGGRSSWKGNFVREIPHRTTLLTRTQPSRRSYFVVVALFKKIKEIYEWFYVLLKYSLPSNHAYYFAILEPSPVWKYLLHMQLLYAQNYQNMSSGEFYIKIIHHSLFSQTVPLSRKNPLTPHSISGGVYHLVYIFKNAFVVKRHTLKLRGIRLIGDFIVSSICCSSQKLKQLYIDF